MSSYRSEHQRINFKSWWSHDKETLSSLLAFSERNPSMTSGPSSQMTSNSELWFFFAVSLNRLFDKQANGRRFAIWRHSSIPQEVTYYRLLAMVSLWSVSSGCASWLPWQPTMATWFLSWPSKRWRCPWLHCKKPSMPWTIGYVSIHVRSMLHCFK